MFRPIKIPIILMVCMVFVLACNFTSLSGKEAEVTPAAVIETDTPSEVSPPTKQPDESPAVDLSPTEAPSPTPIVHLTLPDGTLPRNPQVIHDQESVRKAAQKEAYGGDEFYKGRYERPFDREMNYIPTIDIKQANLFREKDNEFIYAVIQLMEDPSLLPEVEYGFGIELDVDLDGRGDLLIWTQRPLAPKWSVEGVTVWKDANESVGGETPMRNNPPPGGDGYELKIFDSGVGADADLAWSRVSPQDPAFIEIAFKKAILEGTEIFLWGAWAMLGPGQFEWFDHHDHFTYEEAGSPMKSETQYYPLKGVAALDNTCRAASGYTPKGGEPGLCPVTAPQVESGEPEKPGQNCRQVCYNFGAQRVCTMVCD
ncbi:MAG: hypothetical protein HPY59_07885 [Anaerolineae bacterium]|nr:hypothetical protein [Anaerolineae bacterium]